MPPRSAALLAMSMSLILLSGAQVAARESIVGRWALLGSACDPFAGALVIGALDIIGDDVSCGFASVSREGDVVTWRGRCGFPEPQRPATVIAALQGRQLVITVNGAPQGRYRRCS